MTTKTTVEVSGLREFNKALKQLDSNLPKMTRLAMNQCANFLIDKTRPKIPRVSGRAARSLKAKSTRTDVRIAMGGRGAEYVPWLDFGGKGRIPGRPPPRPFIREGRYLYPTLRQNRDAFVAIMERSLLSIAEEAGLEVS